MAGFCPFTVRGDDLITMGGVSSDRKSESANLRTPKTGCGIYEDSTADRHFTEYHKIVLPEE